MLNFPEHAEGRTGITLAFKHFWQNKTSALLFQCNSSDMEFTQMNPNYVANETVKNQGVSFKLSAILTSRGISFFCSQCLCNSCSNKDVAYIFFTFTFFLEKQFHGVAHLPFSFANFKYFNCNRKVLAASINDGLDKEDITPHGLAIKQCMQKWSNGFTPFNTCRSLVSSL